MEIGEYAGLFEQFIVRTLDAVQTACHAEGDTLSLATRQRALRALDYALDSAAAQPFTGKLLLELAPKMEKAGLRDEWIPYLQRAIELSDTPEQQPLKAELLYQLGFLYQLRARYADSVVCLSHSIELFSALQMPIRRAQVMFRLAYVNRLQRNYPQAREIVEAAFALVDSDDPLCAHGYFLRGLLAHDNDDYATAIQEYQQSLQRYEMLGDKRMIALRFGDIGLAYSEWRKFDEAIAYCNLSIEMFEKQQDIAQASVMKMNLGNLYLLQNKPASALVYFDQCALNFRKLGDELHLSALHLNQGIAYRLNHQWQKSEDYLLSAIERWQEMNDLHNVANALDELGQLYVEQQLLAKAKKTFKKAIHVVKQIEQQPGFNALYRRITKHFDHLSKNRKEK